MTIPIKIFANSEVVKINTGEDLQEALSMLTVMKV